MTVFLNKDGLSTAAWDKFRPYCISCRKRPAKYQSKASGMSWVVLCEDCFKKDIVARNPAAAKFLEE